MKEKQPLYIISIVAEMLELHPQTLRQYERMGLVRPSRTIGNTRLYSNEDIERLRFITTLTKELGVNLAGVEVILNMREQISHLQNQMDTMVEYVKSRLGEEFTEKSREGALVPSPRGGIIKITVERED